MLSYPFCFASKHEVLYPRLSINGLLGDKTLRLVGVVEQSLHLELEEAIDQQKGASHQTWIPAQAPRVELEAWPVCSGKGCSAHMAPV